MKEKWRMKRKKKEAVGAWVDRAGIYERVLQMKFRHIGTIEHEFNDEDTEITFTLKRR